MKSIDLLPLELRNRPLYQMVCELIDRTVDVCGVPFEEKKSIVSPLIEELLKGYQSIEAVNIYYNTMIKPIIGTRTVIESVLNLLNNRAEVIEWFEGRFASFKFALVYEDEDTPDIDIPTLISIINEIKNERSHLITIKNKSCESSMIWDYSKWDWDWYDNLPGVDIDGVFVCLRKYIKDLIDVYRIEVFQELELWNSQQMNFMIRNKRWDVFYWDEYYYEAAYESIDQGYLNFLTLSIDNLFENLDSMLIAAYPFYFEIDLNWVKIRAESVDYHICEVEDRKYWYGTWDNPQKVGTFPKYTLTLKGLDEFDINDWEFYNNDKEWNLRIGDFDIDADEGIGISRFIRDYAIGIDVKEIYQEYTQYYSDVNYIRDRTKKWDYFVWDGITEFETIQTYNLVLLKEDATIEGIEYFEKDELWIISYLDFDRALNQWITQTLACEVELDTWERYELRYSDHLGEFARSRWDYFNWDSIVTNKNKQFFIVDVLEDYVEEDWNYLANDHGWRIKTDDKVDNQVGPNLISRNFGEYEGFATGFCTNDLSHVYYFKYRGYSGEKCWDKFEWDTTEKSNTSNRYVLEVLNIDSNIGMLDYFKNDPDWLISYGEFNDDINSIYDSVKEFVIADYEVNVVTEFSECYISKSVFATLYNKWDDTFWDKTEEEENKIYQTYILELVKTIDTESFKYHIDDIQWRVESHGFNEEVWAEIETRYGDFINPYYPESGDGQVATTYIGIAGNWYPNEFDALYWDYYYLPEDKSKYTLEIINENLPFDSTEYRKDSKWRVVYEKDDETIGLFGPKKYTDFSEYNLNVDSSMTFRMYEEIPFINPIRKWDNYEWDNSYRMDNYFKYTVGVVDEDLADEEIRALEKDNDWTVKYYSRDDMPDAQNYFWQDIVDSKPPLIETLSYYHLSSSKFNDTYVRYDDSVWDNYNDKLKQNTILTIEIIHEDKIDKSILYYYFNDSVWSVKFCGIDDPPGVEIFRYNDWSDEEEYETLELFTYNLNQKKEIFKYSRYWDELHFDDNQYNFENQKLTLAFIDSESAYSEDILFHYRKDDWGIKYAQWDDLPGCEEFGITQKIESGKPESNYQFIKLYYTDIHLNPVQSNSWDYNNWDDKYKVYDTQRYTIEILDKTKNSKGEFAEFLGDVYWNIILGEDEDAPGLLTDWIRNIPVCGLTVSDSINYYVNQFKPIYSSEFIYDEIDWDNEIGISTYKYTLSYDVYNSELDKHIEDQVWNIVPNDSLEIPGSFPYYVREYNHNEFECYDHTTLVSSSKVEVVSPQWDWDDEYWDEHTKEDLIYQYTLVTENVNDYDIHSKDIHWSVRSIYDDELPGIEGYWVKEELDREPEYKSVIRYEHSSYVIFNSVRDEYDNNYWDGSKLEQSKNRFANKPVSKGEIPTRYSLVLDTDTGEFDDHKFDEGWLVCLITDEYQPGVLNLTLNKYSEYEHDSITEHTIWYEEVNLYKTAEVNWDEFDWDVNFDSVVKYTLYLLGDVEFEIEEFYNDLSWNIGREGIDDVPGLTRYFVNDYIEFECLDSFTDYNYCFIDSTIKDLSFKVWDSFQWDLGTGINHIGKYTLLLDKSTEDDKEYVDNKDWLVVRNDIYYEPLVRINKITNTVESTESNLCKETYKVTDVILSYYEDISTVAKWDEFKWDNTNNYLQKYHLITDDPEFDISQYKYDTNWKIEFSEVNIERLTEIFTIDIIPMASIDVSLSEFKDEFNILRWDEFNYDENDNRGFGKLSQYSLEIELDNSRLNYHKKDSQWKVFCDRTSGDKAFVTETAIVGFETVQELSYKYSEIIRNNNLGNWDYMNWDYGFEKIPTRYTLYTDSIEDCFYFDDSEWDFKK